MAPRNVRIAGLICVILASGWLGWLYVRQPRTVAQLTGGMAAAFGAYRADDANFELGLRFFRQDQFEEARRAFARADPARQDALTQFYAAYSFYRQGWGRLADDDVLFSQGLEAARRCEALAPHGHLQVDDTTLGLRSSDELIVELEDGLRVQLSDFNPLRIGRARK